MLKPEELTTICGTSSHGSLGHRTIAIQVGIDNAKLGGDTCEEVLHDADVINAAMEAERMLQRAVSIAIHKRYPDSIQESEEQRRSLLSCFKGGHIYAEARSNEYGPDTGHTQHTPWYRVTTHVGVFIIGWRHRVINIDWSGIRHPELSDGNDLFSEEDTTKGYSYVHAWGYDKAREYITKIIQSQTAATKEC